jgi:hypothetical protein
MEYGILEFSYMGHENCHKRLVISSLWSSASIARANQDALFLFFGASVMSAWRMHALTIYLEILSMG